MAEDSDNFIGIYEGAINPDDCAKIIQEAEQFFMAPANKNLDTGATQMPMLEFARHDYSFNASKHLPGAARIVEEALYRCIQPYVARYFVSRQLKASVKEVKLQKTPPRGGYHFWHCESFNNETGNRALAWMIYLNDIPQGEGETEFIWQKLRVQPEAGKCLLWPTQFTHTHRGNPVYTTTKYIATGWYTFDW